MFTRDSAVWWVGMIAGAATFALGNFELLQQAIPSLGVKAHAWLQIIGFAITGLSAYMRMSPAPLSPSSELASHPKDPDKTLTITGSLPKP